MRIVEIMPKRQLASHHKACRWDTPGFLFGGSCIAKTALLFPEPGARGFFDFASEARSNLPRLKNTRVVDCKQQAPTGRRWDFALELGLGRRFPQKKREPAGWLQLMSPPNLKSNFRTETRV
jgi:hypothetical protein